MLLAAAVLAAGRSLDAQAPAPARPLSLEEAVRLARPASETIGIARESVGR